MDFTKLDSRAAAEIGAPLHILHPVTGEPMQDDGKPCRVILRGTESRHAQQVARALNKAKRAAAEKEGDDDDRALEDMHADLVKMAAPLVVGFENVNRGDKPATAEDAEWFLGLNLFSSPGNPPSFLEQVMTFAANRANFLGNGKTG